MSRHVYQDLEAVALYDRSHGLSVGPANGLPGGLGDWCPEAAALRMELASAVCSTLPIDRPTYLLDVGVGNGHWFFNPLITQILKTDCPLRLGLGLGIDNSPAMLQLVSAHWSGQQPALWKELTVGQLVSWWDGKDRPPFESPAVATALVDVEELAMLLTTHGENAARFDVIGLMGVLHHTLSWRLVLDLLVQRLLAPGGIIVLTERSGDAVYPDGSGNYRGRQALAEPGTARRAELKAWHELWDAYYATRSELGVPWEPEIRVTDIAAVVDALLMRGFRFLDGWPKERNWSITYTGDEINRWLTAPSFANFRRHLAGDDGDRMANEVESLRRLVEEHVKAQQAYTVHDGWRIHLLVAPR